MWPFTDNGKCCHKTRLEFSEKEGTTYSAAGKVKKKRKKIFSPWIFMILRKAVSPWKTMFFSLPYRTWVFWIFTKQSLFCIFGELSSNMRRYSAIWIRSDQSNTASECLPNIDYRGKTSSWKPIFNIGQKCKVRDSVTAIVWQIRLVLKITPLISDRKK